MERREQFSVQERTALGRVMVTGCWLLVGASLVVWQSWLTLGLFGDQEPWRNLVDDRPVLSGTHPKHLYLGTLGAQAWRTRGHGCCYDTAFQGAYLKTPVFNGSRFAELFLFLAGDNMGQAAVYKVGLAALCLLVPLFLLWAGRGVGLGPVAAGLAAAIGLLIWWGPAGRQTMEMGDSEFLLAALAALTHVALLVRYHQVPGVSLWLGLVVTAWFSWFAHPFVFPVLLVLLLAYYLTVGVRHSSVTWHLALWGSQLLALAGNAFWLVDWVSYWWLRLPSPQPPVLQHLTLQALWQAPLWGGPSERILAMVLLGSALLGVAAWHRERQRVAARLFGLGAGLCLVLALLGITWEPLGQLGASALLAPALWFAVLPAVHGWTWLLGLLGQGLGAAWRGYPLGLAALGGLIVIFPEPFAELTRGAHKTTPLVLGLGSQREALVQDLIRNTGPEARILWEDRQLPRTAPRWSALLPTLTGRSFLGGLDADGIIEHSAIGLVERTLAGRSISTVSDAALADYCRRYNIGWIVAWTPETAKRLGQWPAAQQTAQLTDDLPGFLFAIKRAAPSFVLKGKARLIHADSHHLTLADVEPENGQVVLSFHYQAGLRATPTRVQVESELDAFDPFGFVRLRVASPVGRVNLKWDRRN